MKRTIAGLLAASLFVAFAAPGRAQSPSELDAMLDTAIGDHLKKHPEEVERIVGDYLTAHPEAVQAAIAALIKKSRAARAEATKEAPDKSAAARADAAALSSSPHQVTLGDLNGDVTLVEFFDYNCGFCRRALPDTLALLKAEPKLKVVLKEFPVLGPGSVDAARVAIAVRMQDPDGARYLAFHQRLLRGAGPNDKTSALSAAKDLGFDPVRLEKDMASDEAQATLAENARLAKDLGLTGTPSYVIGDAVVVGAVGLASLEDKVRSASELTR
jgi:protein-disulfide isomerase